MAVARGSLVRERLVRGALTVCRLARSTYGPFGGAVMVHQGRELLISRDGVSVVRSLSLPDPVENLGCQAMKAACLEMDGAGDGTTTVAILAGQLLYDLNKLVVAGFDIVTLTKEANRVVSEAIEAIRSMRRDLDTEEGIEDLCLVSSRGDQRIARLIAEAVMETGKDGNILIVDGPGVESSLRVENGSLFELGYLFEPEGDETEWSAEGCLVSVSKDPLRSVSDVESMLEAASQYPDPLLLVVAEAVEGDARRTLRLNDKKGHIKSCVLRLSSWGWRREETLEDLSVLSGARMVDRRAGMELKKFCPEWFGSFRRVKVGPKKSVLLPYESRLPAIQTRATWLLQRAEDTSYDYDADQFRKRASSLMCSVCTLEVGGQTESDIREQRSRVEDALASVKLALTEGVVPGGGHSYVRCDQMVGQVEGVSRSVRNAFTKALRAPFRALLSNAGMEPSKWLELLTGSPVGLCEPVWWGLDIVTGTARDLSRRPMLADAAGITERSLTVAVSVVLELLSVEASVWKKR